MAEARNRSRRQGRPLPFREPRPTILVVTEGEVTEPEYLHGLQRACRNPRVTIKVADQHGVPATLVRIAKQEKQEAEARAEREKDENLAYDSVWCIFDIDDHPAIGETKEMARDNGIRLATHVPHPLAEVNLDTTSMFRHPWRPGKGSFGNRPRRSHAWMRPLVSTRRSSVRCRSS